MQGDQMIETEIKIRVPAGAENAVRLLESHGYHVVVPRALQVDQIYDLPDATLRRSGRLLRIRSSRGDAILTYKGPVLGGRHKSREELEAATDQGGVLAEILDRLGYLRSFRYEKYRTTFEDEKGLENALIALDETPIGVFLELEGPGDWIDRTAHRLGFGAGEYITASYASLYRDYLNFHSGPADMVFRDGQNVDSDSA
jgi:adenylate cyclase class 2